MELLDATIALVVTLAALATTVTVLMEIWIRFFGLKSQVQVELFQKIFEKAVQNNLTDGLDQWQFVKKVLNNPLLGREMHEPKDNEWVPYIGSRAKGIYEWVSHEHVYRRLLEMPGVLQATRAELVLQLQQFTHRYDEFCAAASVEFKENRRRWSILGGVLLAIVINADGVRIFNEYMKRPELAAAMASKVDELERTAQRSEERLQPALVNPGSIEEIEKRVAELRNSVADLETAGLPIGWSYPPHCLVLGALGFGDGKNSGKNGAISGKGAGSDGGEGTATVDAACRLAEHTDGGALLWFGSIIAVLGTGVLIGLGAPFWFDVARRLAEVRTFFGGKGSGEEVHSGESVEATKEGKSKSEQAAELINRVVNEALAEHTPTGARRLLTPTRDL